MVVRQAEWLRALKVYLGVVAGGNLVWEGVQLPLYTIWTSGTVGGRAFAALHCTGGDILIGVAALIGALLVVGVREWPAVGFWRVAVLTIPLGVAYTGFSEWLNVSIRQSWAYSEWMPTIALGPLRIGISPLAQWIAVPVLGFWAVRRSCVAAAG